MPQTTDQGDALRVSFFRSRIGRRVLTLFVLSALVPLSLCIVFLGKQFGDALTRTEQHNLDGLVRSYGMTLLARLGSADDLVKAIMAEPGTTEELTQQRIADLPWVRTVTRVAQGQLRRYPTVVLPQPDESQQRALQTHESVLLWEASGEPRLFLLRALPSGAWLYTEIASAWVWAGQREFASDSGLLILDERGRVLSAQGPVPPEVLNAPWLVAEPSPGRPLSLRTISPPAEFAEHWLVRSWELFLAGRFHTPSWRLLALHVQPALLRTHDNPYRYLVGLALATALLVAWLSMNTIRRQLQPLSQLTQAARRVGRKDFSAFESMQWNDEFGDLARSFSAMSRKLHMQFSTLETFSEVDRQLLEAPDLELILETLLPRMAGVLGCSCVSVLLFDPDSGDRLRAHDYWPGVKERLPVRRVATDLAALVRACEQPTARRAELASSPLLRSLAPATPHRIDALGLHALSNGRSVGGVLCIGYADDTSASRDSAVGATEFAARLSLILVNLRRVESLRRQANFDSLTGLQNRALFTHGVRSAVASAQLRGELGGLLYLDLDHFKRVNDTAGHGAGDGLLRIVGERLTGCAEPGQSVARLSGDEFAVLLPQISGPDTLRKCADRILASLQQPIVVDGREHHVTASIGMTVFPLDGTGYEEVLKSGDIAMYQAKDAGRGRAVFFEAEMQRKLLERLSLETEMYRALEQQQFRLFYQPIIDGPTGRVAGVEALVRCPRQDQAAWTPPAVFVPIAEENGLIVELGAWILRSACEQFARWRAAGLGLSYVSVNVSVRQLREADFPEQITAVLHDCGMQPEELIIEITESVLASGSDLEQIVRAIAARGIRLALDDFGTGYSSLSYLRTFPIHTVKIDRTFVNSVPQDLTARRLAESMVLMCSALSKKVTAEGVERPEQFEFLRHIGCDALQGYLFGRPMEADDIPGFAQRLPTPAQVDESPQLSRTGLFRRLTV